jgi:peptide/nickel transport system substrate-binding protein
MHGLATVHQTLVPAGMLGAIDDAPFKLDVAKAEALLAQAGLPDGFKTTMDVINQSPYIDIAQALQASFAQAGVTLELIPGDARQVLTKQRARNHDVYIGRWGPDYEDPDSNAGTFAINTDNGDNPASKTTAWANGWQDAALTAEAQQAVLERDSAKRAQIYAELQRRHQQTSPFAFMFQLSEVIASRKTVEGLTWSATYDRNQYWTGRKP